MDPEDNLEPGQDALVKEDTTSNVFRRVLRGAKNAAPGRSGTDERIYSDPDFTSDPDAMIVSRPKRKMRPDGGSRPAPQRQQQPGAGQPSQRPQPAPDMGGDDYFSTFNDSNPYAPSYEPPSYSTPDIDDTSTYSAASVEPAPPGSAQPSQPQKKGRLAGLKSMWQDAMAEADAKQRAKRDKKQ